MGLNYSQTGLRQTESDIARLMTLALERPNILSLAAGFTDTATLPLADVTRIAQRIGQEDDKRCLQYGPNQGRPELREALSNRLVEQDQLPNGRTYPIENSFIANGSQQALYLAVLTLCDPGDIILVEQPTYFVFLEMLRGLGVNAVSMPMLSSGEVDVDSLQALLSDFQKRRILSKVKAVYLVSYYANPTGRSIASAVKESLMKALEDYDGKIALIEDAAYRELYFESPHPAPSLLKDGSGRSVPIFYTTTLTKPFASGLKIGYAYCTESDWVARMLAVKGQQDFGSANYPQAILGLALTDGVFDAHISKVRSSYWKKMDTLDNALRFHLEGAEWQWTRPQGGLYLWLKAPEGIETHFESRLCHDCLEHDVMYVPGDLCFADNARKDFIRLSFGVLDLPSLELAAERFAGALLAAR